MESHRGVELRPSSRPAVRESSSVKQQAVAVIDEGSELGRWSGKLLERRRAVLAELRAKLLGPQQDG